ncbi:MAG: hypothetical protein ACK42G_05160 [Candidatus Kapaibacteriota bacterium]
MRLFVLFIGILLPTLLLSQQVDTINVKKLPAKFSEELNYYQLTLKSGKKTKSNYYVGYDIESISKIFDTNKNSFKKIQFYNEDTLCYEQTNFDDTNFIWLVQKKHYQWKDTLRISESKKTKKIELSEVYTSYKYLNPIKITIKGENLDIDINNPDHSVMFWVGRRYIFTIPNVTRIVLFR